MTFSTIFRTTSSSYRGPVNSSFDKSPLRAVGVPRVTPGKVVLLRSRRRTWRPVFNPVTNKADAASRSQCRLHVNMCVLVCVHNNSLRPGQPDLWRGQSIPTNLRCIIAQRRPTTTTKAKENTKAPTPPSPVNKRGVRETTNRKRSIV